MNKMEINPKEEFILIHYELIKALGSVTNTVALFIASQFALESSYGDSMLARYHHNISGMKKPKSRPSTCIRDTDYHGFASYDNVVYAIVDYFLCIAYHHPSFGDLEDVGKYACFIKTFYCPEIDYIDRIMSIFNQFTYLLTQNSQQNEK